MKRRALKRWYNMDNDERRAEFLRRVPNMSAAIRDMNRAWAFALLAAALLASDEPEAAAAAVNARRNP